MKHLSLHASAALLLTLGAGLPTARAQVTPAVGARPLELAVGPVSPAPTFAAEVAAAAARAGRTRRAPADAWHGRVFRLMQLERLLTEGQKAELRSLGVDFFDFLPPNAYTVALPATLDVARLAGFGIRHLGAMPADWKRAGELARYTVPAHAQRGPGRLSVVVNYYPALSGAEAVAALPARWATLTARDEFAHQLTLTLAEADLGRLLALPWVSAVEAEPAPGEPENFRARTDHRANALATDYGAGRHYDGTGVTVGHGDDGSIGPHIDFQGRFDISTAGPSGGDHGDHVAGTIMGAGNLEPRNRGMATGAFNFYQDYPDNLNQAPANYADATRRVRVTNSSYSDGQNAGYTAFARTVDLQSRQLPYLLHVFSSGNAGTEDFGYGAGPTWGNVTGGHKMGKNVLTVGNVDFRDQLNTSSSRGPATDGRIKPDVCAVGTDVTSCIGGNMYDVYTGTSMASPGVAGVTAQLVGAYRTINNAPEAPAGLLKAALLNTADDLGNPGPDFQHGYGRINGLRAVRVLEGHTYFADTLAQNESRRFVLSVPPGQKELRVLLHWTDREAAVNSRPNLVNDLDLTGYDSLTGPTPAGLLRPWILDHRPTVAQLSAVAVPGRDSLNNAEQITISDPRAGAAAYVFTVRGRRVPQGPQGFWLTYSCVADSVELTYPLGGEGLVPGEVENIRWDAPATTAPFRLEYSVDNGTTWQVISPAVAPNLRSFAWTVPATATPSGQVRVRVRRGMQWSTSPAPSTIAPLPTGLRHLSRCATEAVLTWTASAGATAYTVYRLGAMYMDSVTTVTTTTATISGLTVGEANWFAVSAVGANGLRSRRTRAIFQPATIRNCAGPPLAAFAPSAAVTCPNTTLTLNDSTQGVPTAWRWRISPSAGVSFVGGTSATSASPQVRFTTPGTYAVTLVVTNQYGTDSVTQTSGVTVTTGALPPFAENFQGGAGAFPPAGWQVVNPSSDYTWELSPQPVTDPTGQSRPVPMVNDYDDNLRGAEDYLIAPPVDLGAAPRAHVAFWVSHQRFSLNEEDGLRVDISTDCGLTFVPTGYLKVGAAFATVPGTGGRFFPAAATDWRRDSIDLSGFRQTGLPVGTPQPVVLRFVNLNDFGNNVFLTNISVYNGRPVGLADAATGAGLTLAAQPVPFGAELRVQTAARTPGAATLTLFDALGRAVASRRLTLGTAAETIALPTEALAAGVYQIRLVGPGGMRQLRVVKQ